VKKYGKDQWGASGCGRKDSDRIPGERRLSDAACSGRKNGEIVPKAEYSDTVLKNGDSIEIVSFVGGG
jgi:thiS: thiamine biosynthesis protein ThiS